MAKNNFRGMPGGMNQAAMMKQAQKLQQEMLRMQQEQETKTYTAKAGGGMVSATVNGKHEVVNIEINPEAVDPDDVEMLQDMIMAAVNEAVRAAAKQEILRRWYAAQCEKRKGTGSETALEKCELLMKQTKLTVADRPVVAAALERSEENLKKRAELTEKLKELYDEYEITVYEGGQEVYDYLVAVE
mgnify:CR=1 FL=1